MRLFHSGVDIIKKPDINVGRKNADFGAGFYLSKEEAFAMRWVKIREGKNSYVNVYELNTDGLNIKELTRDEEWFDYIFNNRNGKKDAFNSFDVIIGPIANDTLYDVLGIPTSGMLSKEDSLGILKLGGEYHQIVLKSERAAKQLEWLEAREINPETISQYNEIIEEETKSFQEQFQKYLEDLL